MFIRHSTLIRTISSKFSSQMRFYRSLSLGINSYQSPFQTPLDNTTKVNQKHSPILRRFVNENERKLRLVKLRMDNLKKLVKFGDLHLKDEVLLMVLYPYQRQHVEVEEKDDEGEKKNKKKKKVLVDVDSIEQVGFNLFNLQKSLVLLERFGDEFEVDILGNSINHQLNKSSYLNQYLINHGILKLPKYGSPHTKKMQIVKARRILFRLIGFINYIHGYTKASNFTRNKIINGDHGLLGITIQRRML